MTLSAAPTKPTKRPRFKEALRRQGPFLVSLVIVLGLWEFLGRTMDLLALPPVTEIAAAMLEFLRDGTLFDSLTVSLITLSIGMVAAIVLGVIIGAAMGLSRTIEGALDIYVNAMMAAPMVAFVPVFILVFGLGYPTRVLTVVIFAIFPIIVNTFAGLRNVDPTHIEMSRSYGATRRQMMWQVRLPGAFPYLLAGIRIGTARGVKGLINGEVLVTVVGLGGLVHRYGTAFSMERLYAIIAYLVALALVLVWLVDRVSRWLIRQE
jgi:NitT/TauT family transport system permease protein